MQPKVVLSGCGRAALHTALDLADGGLEVGLIAGAADLHPSWHERPAALRALTHPRIKVWLEANVRAVGKSSSGYRVEIEQAPQLVDADLCTACGECLGVCPTTLLDETGIPTTPIVRRNVPSIYHISRAGTPPCQDACPVDQHAQGYVALILARRYAEAYRLIKADNPFPSVCGRICNAYCQGACTRADADGPVPVRALKRFVADWAADHPDEVAASLPRPPATGKRVAILGSGPAGLTAAQDLADKGHSVTVFEALPVAGGMLRVGVPAFRLPTEIIEREVAEVLAHGVELRLNTRVDDVKALLDDGFDAVFLAIGAHRAKRLPIPGADLPNVLTSLEVLRAARLGDPPDLEGQRVLVLGGGNVAIDVARTVIRLGATASMTCLESHEQMPATPHEIEAAEAEGITIYPGRSFLAIEGDESGPSGVRCVEVDFGGFVDGRPDIAERPGSEHLLPADVVIFAVGQLPDLSFLLPDGPIERTRAGTIAADPETCETGKPGVFAGSDAVRGAAFFAVDAIAAGHRAGASIDAYLRGEPPPAPRYHPPVSRPTAEEIEVRLSDWGVSAEPPAPIPEVEPARRMAFDELELGYDEVTALAQAARCLRCGLCAGCLACAQVCPPHAIDHHAPPRAETLDALELIWADGAPGDRPGHHLAPDDVIGAHALALSLLATYRPTAPRPPAPAPSARDGRLGVFLCRCGGEIASRLDLAGLTEEITRRTGVDHVEQVPFACQPEGAQAIRRTLRAERLDRAIVAACACCALDHVCMSCSSQRLRGKGQLLRDHGLPLDFVNVREGAAFVHQSVGAATAHAADLIAAGVTRARMAGEAWPGYPPPTLYAALCRACGDCVSACGPGALSLASVDGASALLIDPELCEGCGACAAVCPTGAIVAGESAGPILEAMLAAMEPRGKSLVFSCNWSAYCGAELAGIARRPLPAGLRLVRVPCAARIDAGLLLEAFRLGAAGVLVVGCQPGACHYGSPPSARVKQAADLARSLGVDPARLAWGWLPPGDVEAFVEMIDAFAQGVAAIEEAAPC